MAIVATLSLPIQPRAKFFQTMIFNILGICFGACIALLTCYSAVQARLHTSQPIETSSAGASGTTQAVGYNSSASAVSAIWLFVNILFSNSLRFARPQLQTPVVLYTILANIASTFAPLFADMTQAIAFVKTLIEAFMAGFAIAIVVNLVVFPLSGRQVLFAQYAGYGKLLQQIMARQRAFAEVMEHADMLQPQESTDTISVSKASAFAKSLKESMIALQELHAKAQQGLPLAKREVAFGNLSPTDLEDIFQRFRDIFSPVLGLSSLADIYTRIALSRGWTQGDQQPSQGTGLGSTAEALEEVQFVEKWNRVMQSLHGPFHEITAAASGGIQHALYILELDKKPKTSTASKDPETATPLVPGDDRYVEQLLQKLREFQETRKAAVQVWCQQRNIKLEDAPTVPEQLTEELLQPTSDDFSRRQLYLILYVRMTGGRQKHKLTGTDGIPPHKNCKGSRCSGRVRRLQGSRRYHEEGTFDYTRPAPVDQVGEECLRGR